MENSATFYQDYQAEMEAEAASLQGRATRIAMIRLVYFLVWMCLLILCVQWHWLAAVVLFYAGIVVFSRMMSWHEGVQRSATVHQRIGELCQQELRLLALDLNGRDTGEDLCPPGHPYAVDLDIFGPGSIYSLYARCRTSMGRERLASYLLEVVDVPTVVQRQAAAQELEAMPEWVLRCQAEGIDIRDSRVHYDSMVLWLDDHDHIAPYRWLYMVSLILPFLTIGLFAFLWYQTTFIISLVALLPSAALLWRYRAVIGQMQEQVDKLSAVLAGYSHMMLHIEGVSFTDAYLRDLQSGFTQTPSASAAVQRLAKLIDNLNVRSNVFGIVLNIFTLWDIHYARKLENWRSSHRQQVKQWYESLAEMEALLSVASVGFHNQEWALPTIGTSDILVGRMIGHPLLHRRDRVTNDYTAPAAHHIHLVTGSNMGGKSTFLRTVGLQAVLSYSGSRVCAAAWSMPAGTIIYSSMRTQDAIQESTSGFYAELRRLEGLIDRIEAGERVFFLLDEIFKGTNTQDRNTGAAALMRQLLRYPVAGMISTHDTTLGSMAEDYPGKISNICFEVGVEGDLLTFDYKMKEGVSQSFNATALMRSIGIEV